MQTEELPKESEDRIVLSRAEYEEFLQFKRLRSQIISNTNRNQPAKIVS